MFDRQNTLAKTDSELWAAIRGENRRPEDYIELIALKTTLQPQSCGRKDLN